MSLLPTFSDIEKAHRLISGHIHRTPAITSRYFDGQTGASLFFKCENLQKVGAFKIRGATNAVFSLDEATAKRGVITHSSGNHGAALAQAARWRGIKAWVVMPETAPEIKKKAVASYGAEIVFCRPTQQSREETANAIIKKSGAEFIHPYDDTRVIAGQGTAALELWQQMDRHMDLFITPVGGGGLMSGSSITLAAMSPQTKLFGGEPQQADDAFRSLQSAERQPATNKNTIADGLKTSLSERTFACLRQHNLQIITVSEEEITNAMRRFWERTKLIIEPSSAVPLAAVLKEKEAFAGKRVGIILSGGNVDVTRLPF